MDERTLKALKDSIRHWEENVAATDMDGISTDAEDCALCREFNTGIRHGKECRGCPVYKKTGNRFCSETPYSRVHTAKEKENFQEAHDASVNMLSFLKGLLPEDEVEFGPWKIWIGGERPVGPDIRVQVQFVGDSRFDAIDNTPLRAGTFRWDDKGDEDDIIAYREVIEPKVETVTKYFDKVSATFSFGRHQRDTHSITFEMIDDEPCNPRFERLK